VGDLQLEWTTNLAYQAQLSEQVLDWPAAVAQVRAANLKLRQARTEVTNAQESVRQVFRDLVPTLNFRAGVSKRIIDLPSVSEDDVTFGADSLMQIPGVVSFGARLYVARLGQLRAETAYALVEREQLIELYRLFWNAQEVQAQATQTEYQKTTARAYETIDPFSGQLLSTQTELRELNGQQEGETLQQRVAEILGSHQFRWTLVPQGLPELHYELDPLPLGDTNRVAQLQVRLVAIELEAARAQLAGVKLRCWPGLNIFFLGPPFYPQSFGRARFWDAREVRASADVFWWIDTRGYVSRQLRQTKRQQDLQRARLHHETLALMDRLLFSQGLLKSTAAKEHDLQTQLAVLEAVPPAQNMASLEKYAVEYQNTVDQLRQVRRDLAEFQALFWFVDEKAWAETSPLEPLAAAN